MTVHNHNATSRRMESLQKAHRAKQANAQQRLQYLLEDIAELMDPDFCGETDPDVIARRLGYAKKTSLARRLHRHGHHELARKFDAKYDPEYRKAYRERNAEKVREWNRKALRKYRYGVAA